MKQQGLNKFIKNNLDIVQIVRASVLNVNH